MAKELLVRIVGDSSSLERSLANATDHSSKFGSAVKAGFLAAGAAIAVVGLEMDKSIKAAMEAEQSTARLDQAFKNAGLSAEAAAGQPP